MVRIMQRIALVALVAGLLACGAPDYKPNNRTQTVNQTEYGTRWPLTVAAGELVCPSPGAVVFKSNGTSYALNGTAESTAKYKRVDPILKPDPDTGIVDPRDKLAQLQPLVDAGMQLCVD